MPILLQINVTANWGSTGKIVEAIGHAALQNGWDSYIAYGRKFKQSESVLIKIGDAFNSYLHFAEQRLFDNEGLCSRRATRQLIKHINQLKPDVIHLHNIHDHYLNYEILFEYLNRTNINVVWTFHDCWAFTGHCFHFVIKDCQKWERGCFKCPLRGVYPKTFFDRSKKNYEQKKHLFSSNQNLTIVACSDWMGGFVRRSFLKHKRIEVIKNGVDLSVFRPVNTEGESNRYRVLAVSNMWNEDKGLGDVLRLRSLLPSDYDIIMVGLNSSQISSLPQGITGIQRTDNVQDLVRLYSDANVLVNPTYADTFPTVNLESLACGTPVITYRTGGSPESVTPDTGFVIDQGDVEGMSEAVRIVCANGRQYESACRKRAEEYFDKNECFKKYLTLYESILSINTN